MCVYCLGRFLCERLGKIFDVSSDVVDSFLRDIMCIVINVTFNGDSMHLRAYTIAKVGEAWVEIGKTCDG